MTKRIDRTNPRSDEIQISSKVQKSVPIETERKVESLEDEGSSRFNRTESGQKEGFTTIGGTLFGEKKAGINESDVEALHKLLSELSIEGLKELPVQVARPVPCTSCCGECNCNGCASACNVTEDYDNSNGIKPINLAKKNDTK